MNEKTWPLTKEQYRGILRILDICNHAWKTDDYSVEAMKDLLTLQKFIAPNLYKYLEEGFDILWEGREKPVKISLSSS